MSFPKIIKILKSFSMLMMLIGAMFFSCRSFAKAAAEAAAGTTGGAISAKQAMRFQSLNVADSAPLNQVRRVFNRLEATLPQSIESQKLLYRFDDHGQINFDEMIHTLLHNIDGSRDETAVEQIDSIPANAREIRSSTYGFAQPALVTENSGNEILDAVDEFTISLRAAIGRSEMRLFSARILDQKTESRLLILVDDKTREIFIAYLMH